MNPEHTPRYHDQNKPQPHGPITYETWHWNYSPYSPLNIQVFGHPDRPAGKLTPAPTKEPQ